MSAAQPISTSSPAPLIPEESVARALHTAPAPVAHSRAYEVTMRFVGAGVGSMMSSFVTNPVDMIKVRQQLEADKATSQNFVKLARNILRDEGPSGLMKGVTASLMREASYSTIRIGSYELFKENLHAQFPSALPSTSLSLKVAASMLSGGIGNLISNPIDLVKVRMQKSYPNGARPFPNAFAGLAAVYREGGGTFSGGIRSLWKGTGATVTRAAILTSSQIASYDHFKHWLLEKGYAQEGVGLHLSASLFAGLFCSLTSNPFDVIKVRLMSDKTREFSGMADCAAKLLRNEGPLALYKGFTLCWARLGTHSTLALMVFEQVRRAAGIKPM